MIGSFTPIDHLDTIRESRGNNRYRCIDAHGLFYLRYTERTNYLRKRLEVLHAISYL